MLKRERDQVSKVKVSKTTERYSTEKDSLKDLLS